jgi:hypothetical protein
VTPVMNSVVQRGESPAALDQNRLCNGRALAALGTATAVASAAGAVVVLLYATTLRVSNVFDAQDGVGGVPHGAADCAGHHGIGPTSVEGDGKPASASPDDHEGGLAARTVDGAVSMLLVHVAGVDGPFAGCADRGRFAMAPCPVARWARSVVETHGVAVWDARPSGYLGGSLTPMAACEMPSLSRVAV